MPIIEVKYGLNFSKIIQPTIYGENGERGTANHSQARTRWTEVEINRYRGEVLGVLEAGCIKTLTRGGINNEIRSTI
jgi:hypothetical protein